PYKTMSSPGFSFSLAISSATFSLMIVVLFHLADLSVVKTTYFGIPFMRSAKPSSFGAVGQNALNISYVTRPSSIAPDANASSILYRCWSSPRTPTPTRSSRRRAARGRCLHHAVERDELGRDQSSHDILFTLRR